METYYKDQFNRIEVGKTEYAPTVKIFANGNGEDTKNISLNKESAKDLIKWLSDNFIKDEPKIYVDNGQFIELVSELATELTEQHFYDKTYELAEDKDGQTFTDEAQDFYMEKYDEIEAKINETINVYSKIKRIFQLVNWIGGRNLVVFIICPRPERVYKHMNEA